eukprot:6436295-Amphidinium_carterae.1
MRIKLFPPLLTRLRQPVMHNDAVCLLCADNLDRFGRHGVVWSVEGNALCAICYMLSGSAL